MTLQESDDEDTSDVQPIQKKRRSEISGPSNQDDSAVIHEGADVQTGAAFSYEEGAQNSGARTEFPSPGSVHQGSSSSREDRREKALLEDQEDGPPASSTGLRAVRTQTALIITSCTTCEKEIPYGPRNQSRQCVACRRKAQALSVVHQQAPAPTAVMVAPPAVMVPPGFAPPAVMVAQTPPTGQALQLQGTQAQSAGSKIEVLEQRIRKQEIEKDGLEAMLEEDRRDFARQKREIEAAREEDRRELARQKRELKAARDEQCREFARQKREFESAHDEIIRLEALIQQSEEQM